jgi:uncharacterized protein with PQ loop repeat
MWGGSAHWSWFLFYCEYRVGGIQVLPNYNTYVMLSGEDWYRVFAIETVPFRPDLRLCYIGDMHYLGLRHKHERQQLVQKRSQSPYIVFLDKLTFIVGVIGPFTVLPQIYSIFSSRSAAGVSLMTWLLIFIVTFPWILYGLAHKDRSIIVSFILWEVVNLTVVIGVLLYG